MTPSAAIESGVFRIYAVLIGGALAVAALIVLWIIPARSGRRHEAARAKLLGWLIIAPVTLVAMLLGREVMIIFLGIVSILAIKEFARATGLYRDWMMMSVVYLGLAACTITALVEDPFLLYPGWVGLFLALPVYVIAAILIVPVLRNRFENQLQAIALAITGFVYIGWMFGHLMYLANSSNAYGYLLFLLTAVSLADIAAFVVGRSLGRRPLRSRISPNKTLEGWLGALAVSMALPWALWFSFPGFSVPEMLLTGLIVGIGGHLGDLSISVIKRDLGIKDMGCLVPGHGGVLDRIDSLIFTAPLFFHMVNYYRGIY